jgi:hypothetical protein
VASWSRKAPMPVSTGVNMSPNNQIQESIKKKQRSQGTATAATKDIIIRLALGGPKRAATCLHVSKQRVWSTSVRTPPTSVADHDIEILAQALFMPDGVSAVLCRTCSARGGAPTTWDPAPTTTSPTRKTPFFDASCSPLRRRCASSRHETVVHVWRYCGGLFHIFEILNLSSQRVAGRRPRKAYRRRSFPPMFELAGDKRL